VFEVQPYTFKVYYAIIEIEFDRKPDKKNNWVHGEVLFWLLVFFYNSEPSIINALIKSDNCSSNQHNSYNQLNYY